jgi:hypothetical protein
VVESGVDNEPATGNELVTESEHDPEPETPDTANEIVDDESPGKTNTT